MAYALAIGALTTSAAAGTDKFAESDGNIRYLQPVSRKATSASDDVGEPTPVYPEDPHRMLKRSIDENPTYKCHVVDGTRKLACIDTARVRSNGALRASELLAGRPERVRGTGLSLLVDCRRMLVVLHDRHGAQFSGESPAPADALKALSAKLCASSSTMPDPTLRML